METEREAQRIISQDLFLPFHSSSRVLRAHAAEDAHAWKRDGTTLGDLLHAHDKEAHFLFRSKRYVFEDGPETYDFSRDDTQTIRKLFSIAANHQRPLVMNGTGKLLFALNAAAEELYTNVKGKERTLERPLSHTLSSQCALDDRVYLEFTRDVVAAAVGVAPSLVRKREQLLLTHALTLTEGLLGKLYALRDAPESAQTGMNFSSTSPFGEEVLTIDTLRNYTNLTKQQAREFLRGFVLHGAADTAEARAHARERYPVCLDGKTPFNIAYGVDLPVRKDGIWRARPVGVYAPDSCNPDDLKTTYIHLNGWGLRGFSDIGGIVEQKLTAGTFGMLGAMIADGCDFHAKRTYDQFFGNLPGYLAHSINEKYMQLFGEPLVSAEEIAKFVYLGAEQNIQPLDVSGSHRAMNLVSPGAKETPIYTLTQKTPSLPDPKTDNSRIHLGKIVPIVEQRLENYERIAA